MTYVIGILVLLCTLWAFGPKIAWVLAFVVSVAVYPRVVISTGVLSTHVGMAGVSPDISTYTLVIFAGILCLLITGRLSTAGLSGYLPFLLLGALLCATVWVMDQQQWAGVLQLALGVGSWLIGTSMRRDGGPNDVFHKAFCFVLVAAVFVQLGVAILQGLGIVSADVDAQTAELVGTRISGTLNHPNNLGKVLVLIVILLLPLTESQDRKVGRVAWTGVLVALVPLALTGGRAVFLGALASIILWILIQPTRGRTGKKVSVLLAVVGVASLFAGAIVSRFEEDPSGGFRERLTEAAGQQIAMTPWSGTGPNSYVDVVGRLDGLTASGWPVHNTLLLAVAELGVPLAVFLFLPPAVAIIRASTRIRSIEADGPYARALIASLPALALVCLTGWGMLGGSILPLWFFAMGYLAARAVPFRGVNDKALDISRKLHYSDTRNSRGWVAE